MSKPTTRSLAAALLFSGMTSLIGSAEAGAPPVTVGYQPMVSTGLAVKQPFEAWFVLDKSADPTVPGYALPAGATVRLAFLSEFVPIGDDPHLEAALLYGWPHGAVPVPFSITQDKLNPRVVIVRIDRPISVSPPERPGLKAIHVRTGELNPVQPGDNTDRACTRLASPNGLIKLLVRGAGCGKAARPDL